MDIGENEELRDKLLGRDNEDDLEYYITFPSPTVVKSSSGSEEEAFDLIQDYEALKEPVVFLLGWAGCNDSHLSKYSKIYEDRGCVTIRYTAPPEYVFFKPEQLRPLSVKLLDLIADMSLEASPILFHCFSNNGVTVYQYMAEALSTIPEYAGLRERVKGFVFDSGPGRRTGTAFVRAFQSVSRNKNSFVKFFLPRLIWIYVCFMWFCQVIIGIFTGTGTVQSCYDFLRTDSCVRPSLFIYSKSDSIFPASDVEEVANARENSGCVVNKICFDDSEHVNHLREHREVYITAIDNFIKKILSKEESQQINS